MTVWLVGAQSHASCKAVEEVLASSISIGIVEIRVVRQFVGNAIVYRDVENTRDVSPSKRMHASTVSEDDPTTCDALRTCSPTRTALSSLSSSASRPPGL
ncbi:hypothetical protein D1007_12570 [Hordeum vulgare]|nr:hypothetical protein D1007_12570 [Hordeum vulgare]